jgi:DNA helicase-2/ATP-dependent DNA helicase PcrA
LIYFRIRLEGITTYDHVKHLLVDEMQDYTPVQYAVLSRLFLCRKTILGDVSQTVNPYSASSAETIERVFPQADIVKLYRSYRSTWEITAFAQRITPIPTSSRWNGMARSPYWYAAQATTRSWRQSKG